MSTARYHATIDFPLGVVYCTDQWSVDTYDGWTVQRFIDDMCFDLRLDSSAHWLLKGGLPLVPELLISDSISPGDVLELVVNS